MSADQNFDKIAKAIAYIRQHFKAQPSLDQVAEAIHMSPFHFQRLFTEWAGVSPKKSIQYLTIEHAKTVPRETQSTLSEAAHESGLSGIGRLHDLFIGIEAMSPGEYKNGGASLTICHSYFETPFGTMLAASTEKGVCYVAFIDDIATATDRIRRMFPSATHFKKSAPSHATVQGFLSLDFRNAKAIRLHLKGTPFQLKVWKALLSIPLGGLSTYGSIAAQIDHPKACRAVGTAVGDNPISVLVPCHRVIRSDGSLGQYYWGPTRKAAIVG